jgi:uncharacterized protein YndB with AHSA1/START domain
MANDRTTPDPTFEITRVFNADRDRVWQTWTEAALLEKWWGPKGCSLAVHRLEFRPGGFFHYAMKFAGAPDMWGRFLYREIAAPARIVWLNSFSNEKCGLSRAPFSELCPLEIENVVTFSEAAGKTTVLLRAQPFGAIPPEHEYFEALRPSLEQGYGGTFEQLADFLRRARGG